jgi:hypothetical protein
MDRTNHDPRNDSSTDEVVITRAVMGPMRKAGELTVDEAFSGQLAAQQVDPTEFAEGLPIDENRAKEA